MLTEYISLVVLHAVVHLRCRFAVVVVRCPLLMVNCLVSVALVCGPLSHNRSEQPAESSLQVQSDMGQ